MSYLDKLAKVEALLQRASSEGERHAAELAKGRILSKIADLNINRPLEYKITFDSPWKKRLFKSLCAKYGFYTYRYARQKFTTTNLKIPKNIMDEALWPDFLRWSKVMEELVEEIMKDLADKIHKVQEEEMEIAGEIAG